MNGGPFQGDVVAHYNMVTILCITRRHILCIYQSCKVNYTNAFRLLYFYILKASWFYIILNGMPKMLTLFVWA